MEQDGRLTSENLGVHRMKQDYKLSWEGLVCELVLISSDSQGTVVPDLQTNPQVMTPSLPSAQLRLSKDGLEY